MSESFYCPACNKQIAVLPLTKPIECTDCGQTYWYPNEPIPETSIPRAQPLPSEPATTTQAFQSIRKRTIRNRFQPAESWLDLFDWKFEKFLTPWIIRATWLACVCNFAVFLILTATFTIISMAPEIEKPKKKKEVIVGNQRIRETGVEFRLPPIPTWLTTRFAQAVGAVTTIIFSCLGMLWIRMILEMAIVVFHIANSLSKLEQNLT